MRFDRSFLLASWVASCHQSTGFRGPTTSPASAPTIYASRQRGPSQQEPVSFHLVGAPMLSRWYEAEPDAERQARMDEWLADLLDDPWARSHDPVPGPNSLLRLAIVPGTG